MIIQRLGGLLRLLRQVDPRDKAEIYSAWAPAHLLSGLRNADRRGDIPMIDGVNNVSVAKHEEYLRSDRFPRDPTLCRDSRCAVSSTQSFPLRGPVGLRARQPALRRQQRYLRSRRVPATG
jgi:hypothetical protein